MKTLSIGHSDLQGGASIAAMRTHHALREQGLDTQMLVDRKLSGDWTIKSRDGNLANTAGKARTALGNMLPTLLYQSSDTEKRSFNWLPSRRVTQLNRSDADLIHLHWCNNETLSIREIAKIKKPVVQTLHDMWAFCGSEHYSTDNRWIDGYDRTPKPSSISGFDIDRWTWQRKQSAWKQPWHIVAVSQWLADCASQSALLQGWPISVIPNPVNINQWKPLDRAFARDALSLPQHAKIITFGAIGGTRNPRKGYSLLLEALQRLKLRHQNIHLVVYGQAEPEHSSDVPFPVSFLGKLNDPASMNLLNNASDVFVNPAIQEAFGQTGSEAQASGLPAVGFQDTGMQDVIAHQDTGYLAAHADAEDLANGISFVLDQHATHSDNQTGESALRTQARRRATELFSYDTVATQYMTLYQSILNP